MPTASYNTKMFATKQKKRISATRPDIADAQALADWRVANGAFTTIISATVSTDNPAPAVGGNAGGADAIFVLQRGDEIVSIPIESLLVSNADPNKDGKVMLAKVIQFAGIYTDGAGVGGYVAVDGYFSE